MKRTWRQRIIFALCLVGSAASGGCLGCDRSCNADATCFPDVDGALETADPTELTRVQYRSEAAAYLFDAYVNADGIDPNSADASEAQFLTSQYAGPAWSLAGQWMRAMSPSAIPPATSQADLACGLVTGCRPYVECALRGKAHGFCALTGCGTTACKGCPTAFDISPSTVRGWCSYTCMNYETNEIDAAEISLVHEGVGKLAQCFALDQPVP